MCSFQQGMWTQRSFTMPQGERLGAADLLKHADELYSWHTRRATVHRNCKPRALAETLPCPGPFRV